MAEQDPNIPAPAPTPTPEPAPGPVPYERFAEINQRLKDATAQLTQLKTAQQTAEEAALKEQNKWKELYEQRESELKSERQRLAKIEVASKKGLPVDLAARLQGDTPEALEADADALLSIFKVEPPKSPGVPPSGGASGRGQKFDITGKTAAEIREARAKGLI